MTKITSLPTIAGALLAFGLSAAPAHALATATFVSGHGTDSGACAVAAPCRSFAFALSQTAAGGEIVVLDPNGYGAVTITKSISILNDGVGTAGIAASSGNAITINAGASDFVHLRGLILEGNGTGTNGIQFNTGRNLAIENCVIRNFANAGINIVPSRSSSFSFSVSNTIASDNSHFGIIVQTIVPGAAVTGVLSKVITNNNNDGGSIVSAGTYALINVTIVDSVASNNLGVGVGAESSPRGANVMVMLRDVVASNNGTGLFAELGAVLRVAHSVVTGNGTGVSGAGSLIASYGDNDIDGNTNNNTGVLTKIPMH